jgi:hypothetical protein
MMLQLDELADLLGPVRDVHVAAILELLARELNGGGEVDAEPISRDADGRVSRQAPLRLPRRRDLSVLRRKRRFILRAPTSRGVSFEPMRLGLRDGAHAHVAPFCWGDATVRLDHPDGSPEGAPDWKPLRLWFLEWFQPRFGEESPDLLGVVHALEGPFEEGDAWRFRIDLGSAPVACFPALLEALSACGRGAIRIGETAKAA